MTSVFKISCLFISDNILNIFQNCSLIGMYIFLKPSKKGVERGKCP